MPERMSERISEYPPDRMSDRMSEYISNKYFHVSETMSEYLSGWGTQRNYFRTCQVEGCWILCQPACLLLAPSSFLLWTSTASSRSQCSPGPQQQPLDQSVPLPTSSASASPAGPPQRVSGKSVRQNVRIDARKNARISRWMPEKMPDKMSELMLDWMPKRNVRIYARKDC